MCCDDRLIPALSQPSGRPLANNPSPNITSTAPKKTLSHATIGTTFPLLAVGATVPWRWAKGSLVVIIYRNRRPTLKMPPADPCPNVVSAIEPRLCQPSIQLNLPNQTRQQLLLCDEPAPKTTTITVAMLQV